MPAPRPPTVRWVSGLPLPVPAAAGGFGIEVAFDDETGTFVTLADEGRFARVLLARLAGGLTGHRGFFALKLQRDALRTQAGLGIDNRDVEVRWQRQRQRLLDLAGQGVAALVIAGSADGAIDPVAFDRKHGRLFRIAGPRSWRPLRTCRDDAALRAARLEPWSTSTVRYLRDPADGEGVFYTAAASAGDHDGKDGARVRTRHDLFRDLVAAWAAADAGVRAEVTGRLPDLAAVLADLDADEVEQRLVPLCCHEAFALATELHELHFDEYCDLAGGASFAAAVPVGASLGRAIATADLEARLDGPQQWLTMPWTAGAGLAALAGDAAQQKRLATEAAFLKLHAFGAACRGIAAYHARFGEPHLGIAAENLMLRAAGSPGSPAPARWGFEVAWTDACASVPKHLDGRGQDVAAGLCQPALDGGRIYHSPALADATAVVELALRIAASPLREGEVVVGLRCELPTTKDRLRGIAAGDVVRIVPEAPLPVLGGAPLLGNIVAIQRQGAVVEFRPDAGAPVPLPGSAFAFAATVAFHRRLRPQADLFSLGMLLARALLVNDERDLFAVREVWDRVLDRLTLMTAGASSVDGAKAAAVMRGLLDSERANFDSNSVLYCKELRATSSPLPPVLWREMLLAIARLLTSIDGFSLIGTRPAAGEAVDAPLRRLIGTVDSLLAALRIELCEQNARRDEIAGVAEAMLAELEAGSRIGGGA